MEQVQFEENQEINPLSMNRKSQTSILTSLFIKLGLAKDQKQADKAMLVVSVLCLIPMTYFIISTFFPNLFDFTKPKPATTPASIQERLNALRNKGSVNNQ